MSLWNLRVTKNDHSDALYFDSDYWTWWHRVSKESLRQSCCEAKNVFTFQVKKEHNIPSMDKHDRPITSGIHANISPISFFILTISLWPWDQRKNV